MSSLKTTKLLTPRWAGFFLSLANFFFWFLRVTSTSGLGYEIFVNRGDLLTNFYLAAQRSLVPALAFSIIVVLCMRSNTEATSTRSVLVALAVVSLTTFSVYAAYELIYKVTYDSHRGDCGIQCFVALTLGNIAILLVQQFRYTKLIFKKFSWVVLQFSAAWLAFGIDALGRTFLTGLMKNQ